MHESNLLHRCHVSFTNDGMHQHCRRQKDRDSARCINCPLIRIPGTKLFVFGSLRYSVQNWKPPNFVFRRSRSTSLALSKGLLVCSGRQEDNHIRAQHLEKWTPGFSYPAICTNPIINLSSATANRTSGRNAVEMERVTYECKTPLR